MLTAMVILLCYIPLLKIAETCSRITTCLYITVSSYGSVAGIKDMRRLTTGYVLRSASLCERHSVLTQTQTVQYSLLHT